MDDAFGDLGLDSDLDSSEAESIKLANQKVR